MASGFIGIPTTEIHGTETHEQFVQRASRIFPSDYVRSWSRVERAVFNYLLGPMIHQFSYSAITDAMLEQCRNDMTKILSRLSTHTH